MAAWDDHGKDVSALLRDRDREYVRDFTNLPYAGFSNLHRLTLDLGDSFDLTIVAAPTVRSGAMGFKNVNVMTTKDSYYIRRVRTALTQAFGKDVKIDVKDQARKILEQTREGASYKAELASFDLTEVRVKPDALVLVVEFRLVVH